MYKNYFIVLATIVALSANAQVHVRDEPRHHNVFENNFIRVLDVHLGPGDTTLYHLHNTPSVFICLSTSKVGSQLLGSQPEQGTNINGEISYDTLATPRIHHVWNMDTGWFHVMDVELVGKKQELNIPVLEIDLLKLIFKEKEVNGYKAELKQGNSLTLPATTKGYLLVSLTNAQLNYSINGINQHRIMKAGHYIWMESANSYKISVGDNKPAEFVLLQLK
jgi:hypothetical protein